MAASNATIETFHSIVIKFNGVFANAESGIWRVHAFVTWPLTILLKSVVSSVHKRMVCDNSFWS